MATFRKLTREDLAKLRPRSRGSVDLAEYMDFLRELPKGTWAEVRVLAGETQRTTKRRVSMAATKVGRAIKWRRSEQDVVRFEMAG